MKKSKLIQLLASLSSHELSKLEDFVISPYFNRDKTIIHLFRFLKELHPGFSDSKLTKPALFQSLFPNHAYDDKQLRYLMSGLKKLIERFLAIASIEQHPYQSELALLSKLSEKRLEATYNRRNRQLEKKLANPKEDSSAFFLARLKWLEIQEEDFRRKRLRKFDKTIQYAAQNLDCYYFLHRLKLSCAMLDRQGIFQTSYQLQLSDEWIQHLLQQHFFEEPIIRLYYTIFQALKNQEEEKHFENLKNYLESYANSIPSSELNDIYLFAINYCARKIRQGKNAYLTEALELYRSGIASGVLIDNGHLSPWAFNNVVKLSLRLQHYDWIETFIHDYTPKLPEAFRENAWHYSLAELYYYTQKHDLAQQHLVRVSFSDMNYYLGARVLLAKIYYELQEEEPLLSLIASFTIFLKRNKQLSNNLKQTYLNFCDILFKIVRQNPRQLKRLKEEIKSTALLTDRQWLASIYEGQRSLTH